jgi:hypothetical protein
LRRALTLSRHELQIMGTRARSVAEAHFSWPSSARTLVDAYRSALDHVDEGSSNRPAHAFRSALEIVGRDDPHDR